MFRTRPPALASLAIAILASVCASQGYATDAITYTGHPGPPGERSRTAFTVAPPQGPLAPQPANRHDGRGRTILLDRSQASIATPAPIMQLEGIPDTGQLPSDSRIAVGLDFMVQVTRGRMLVSDKCGTPVFVSSLDTLIGDYTSQLGAPDVIYDKWDDRFLVSVPAWTTSPAQSIVYVIGFTSSFQTGITDGWIEPLDMSLDGSSPTPNRAQNVRIGVGPDVFCLVSEQYTNAPIAPFQYMKLRVFDKSDFYYTYAAPWTDFLHLLNIDSSHALGILPVRMHSWSGGYLLANVQPGGGNFMTLWEVTGAASPTLTASSMTLSPYYPVKDAYQPDSTVVSMGSCAIGGAVFESDTLWATHMSGDLIDYENHIRLHKIYVPTRTPYVDGGLSIVDYQLGHVGFDRDAGGRGIVSFTMVSDSLPLPTGTAPGIAYIGFDGSGWALPIQFWRPGDANYSNGFVSPYFWDNACSVVRDPREQNTLWIGGTYASAVSPPSWGTSIAMTSYAPPGNIVVTPVDTTLITAYEGSTTYGTVNYYIGNNGGSLGAWRVHGIGGFLVSPDTSEFARTLAVGQQDTVEVYASEDVRTLPPGDYYQDLLFEDCISGSVLVRTVRITVVPNPDCAGSDAFLVPLVSPSYATNDYEERGVYVTAIKDVHICAIGLSANMPRLQPITVRVFEADGTMRGMLVAEATSVSVNGWGTELVPIDVTLHACRDYKISFEFSEVDRFDYVDESSITLPFDVLGMLRVNDGSRNGDASDPYLPLILVTMSSPVCEPAADLAPPDVAWTSVTDRSIRGVYATANQTINLCSVGWVADVPSPPATLNAYVYSASGTSRGTLLAWGELAVAASGMQLHQIPISYVLEEGEEYDISVVQNDSLTWQVAYEDTIAMPYLADDVLWVRDANIDGNASNVALGHFTLSYMPVVGGVHVEIGRGTPVQYYSSGPAQWGLYVTSLTDLNIYSIGWKGDVSPGDFITARIYNATGTARGSLIAEGTMTVSGQGLRWHDIPVSVALDQNGEYDIEIEASDSNHYEYWSDSTVFPYTRGGVIEVREDEAAGDPIWDVSPEIRIAACDNVLTDVASPVRPPRFHVGMPYPNPASSTSHIDFSLDRAGPVTITVYDVAGRRVATLLSARSRPAGPGRVAFDTGGVASGVYFLKMETSAKHVSRKITVVR